MAWLDTPQKIACSYGQCLKKRMSTNILNQRIMPKQKEKKKQFLVFLSIHSQGLDYWCIIYVTLITLLKSINCWLSEMDRWDIEALSEESKFQIRIEDHCFDFGYNNSWEFIYLYIYTDSPGLDSLLQLMTTLRPKVCSKNYYWTTNPSELVKGN